ncbi:MAG: UvrD-helicase domain-containing protein [Bacilli bacterium]
MIPIKPKDVIWTDEQWQAIYENNCNIIVSAGAGSGKTAVLTERIIEKLKSGISLNNLIILTFTNAAAFEMKERVRKKIMKEVENGHCHLEKELLKLPNAVITTFDSFSLSLVKKYHYLLNIPKNINIVDSVVINSQKRKLMEEVFREMYDEKNTDFLDLIDTFTVKDDAKMQASIISIDNKLNNLINVDQFLEEYYAHYFEESFIDQQINNYLLIMRDYCDNITISLKKLDTLTHNSLLEEWFAKLLNSLSGIQKCTIYNDYKILSIIKLPTIPSNKELDEDYLNRVKKEYNDLKANFTLLNSLCSYNDITDIKEEIYATKRYIKVIIELIRRYRLKVYSFKQNLNSYEFHDIALMAIRLMEENANIANEYKATVNEIMIDEYQDTNDIQDYFISLIANNNVYMVGDVKQSIYGFRNANPLIFMHKYNNYKNNVDGKAIDLNKNFRSRLEVIEAINNIFSKIMDQTLGGADYVNQHQMIFGNLTYETKGNSKQNNNLEILNYEYLDKKYKKDEIEAFIIARDINNKIKSNYQIFDGQLRNVKYSDFCILMDRKSSFELYRKIFTYLNIPVKVHSEVSLSLSNEIYVIRSILRLVLALDDKDIYHQYFEHSFISLARSFLYDYSDDEIFNIFTEAKKQNQDIITILGKTDQKRLIDQIIDIKNYCSNHSLVELIDYIYDQFDIYNRLNLLNDVEGRTIKLEYFRDVVSNLELIGYTLNDLCNYLDAAIDDNMDITFNMNENDVDAVNIMTIHKSKGLEYPICYYAGLSKKFNKDDLKDKYTFDSDLGIIVPIFKDGIKETIYKDIIKYNYQKKDISERLRVLYVALTRAKEKLIVVADLTLEEENLFNNVVIDSVRLKYKSFKDVFLSLPRTLKPYIKDINLDQVSLSKDYEIEPDINLSIDMNKHKDYKNFTIAINKSELISEHYSISPVVIDKTTKENLNLGLRFHEILEHLDFKNFDSSLATMKVENRLKVIIDKLMTMPFMKDISSSELYHEYEFIYNNSNGYSHGIIDLMIVHPDKITVVDYKTKEIDKEQYYRQVKGYMEYIESITDRPVEGYLYSIMDGIYLKVDNK